MVSGEATFGHLKTPGTGGTLKCDAGTWGNSPTNYTYQWFVSPRTPEAITEPVTKPETSDELTLTEDGVSKPVLILCKVTATNAGGSSTMWSKLQTTYPPPPNFGGFETPKAKVTFPAGTSVVSTKVNGGAVFETCKANTTDVCKAGVPGPSMGQFSQPRGVAVDNSPGGNGAIYVGDDKNYRVQKLSQSGAPILEIGFEVNRTTGANLCVAGSGDDCDAARTERCEASRLSLGGPVTGRAGRMALLGGCLGVGVKLGWDELGNTIAVDQNSGKVFVDDPYELDKPWEGRIQAFDSSGHFIGQSRVPRPISPIEGTSIGLDNEEHVLVPSQYEAKRGVVVLDESDFTPEGTQKGWAERFVLNEAGVSMDATGDPTSNRIWVVDRNESDFNYGGAGEPFHVCGNETNNSAPRRGLLAYDNEGHFLDCTVPQGAARSPALPV